MYCKKCGAELKEHGPIIEYCEISGAPIRRYRCPKNPCHQGHLYKPLPKNEYSRWNRIFGTDEEMCRGCGKRRTLIFDF